MESQASNRWSVLEPMADETVVARFGERVQAWWRGRFAALTLPQRMAVPAIHEGRHTLVCAPTGSGKTLCAFVSVLDALLAQHDAGTLAAGVQCVYVSPLKALGRDIERNLLGPLGEMVESEKPPASQKPSTSQRPSTLQKPSALPGGRTYTNAGSPDDPSAEPRAFAGSPADLPIRVAMRTGDTTASERARMLRRPPHILITTPESLALCLANEKMRGHLASVRTIIVDELHSVASSKRGVDLAVTLERLSLLVMKAGGADPVRVGLSATIAPLEKMAEYLVGPAAGGRACAIADASFERALDLTISAPFTKTPFATSAAISKRVYEILLESIRANRTTLVFTNTRAATERVTFALRKRVKAALEQAQESPAPGKPPTLQKPPALPGGRTRADTGATNHPSAEPGAFQPSLGAVLPEQIEAHHSSLDRDLRLAIEDRLKRGTLRCVVCSTSLELGIDVGTIDEVILLNSPKGIARGLQRVGRSGHRHGAVARGRFVPTVPSDVVESVLTAAMMKQRRIDPLRVPANCLDVLAQQLLGMAVQAWPGRLEADEAFELLRRTVAFADLPREEFDAAVRYLAGDIGGAKIDCDGRTLCVLRKGIRAIYAQNVGTITAEGSVRVKTVAGESLGAVEESFAQLLKPGDRFVLGGRCVQFVRTEKMTVHVAPSEGQTPTVPRWYSGQMPLGQGLVAEIKAFRAKAKAVAAAGEPAVARLLMRQWQAPAGVAQLVAQYAVAQHRYAEIPTDEHLSIERVPDEDTTALVFHTMLGRAANEAIARLVAYRMHSYFGGNAAVVVDDYAFGVWVLHGARRADRTLVRCLLSPQYFERDLELALAASELFRTQFRYTALRAHAIVQNRFSRRRFIGELHGHANRLLSALVEDAPDHLLMRETRRTILEDLLDAPAARDYLIRQQQQAVRILDLQAPSPFAFGLFATSRRDTLQLADTADFLLAMYNRVQARLACETPPADAQGSLFS